MRRSKRNIALLIIAASTSLLSGCFLQVLSGIALRDDDSLVVIMETDSIIASCTQGGFLGGEIECNYLFLDPNGFIVDTTSTAQLISEFGFLGVILDPLVVQIPETATNIAGTYDDGAGNSGALIVRSGFKSIPVDVSRHLFAEHRQQFMIAELPEGVPIEDVQYHFTLRFDLPINSPTPVQVKPFYTLKASDTDPPDNFEFYSPLLPCTTDLAQIPAVAIPEGDAPVPIDVTADLPAACDDEVYRYLGFGVFRCDFDEDSDVDVDDLRRQASVRNAPALPGDRLDTNGNGYIDLNDVRRCALTCTSPRCQVQGADLLASLEEEDAS